MIAIQIAPAANNEKKCCIPCLRIRPWFQGNKHARAKRQPYIFRNYIRRTGGARSFALHLNRRQLLQCHALHCCSCCSLRLEVMHCVQLEQ